MTGMAKLIIIWKLKVKIIIITLTCPVLNLYPTTRREFIAAEV